MRHRVLGFQETTSDGRAHTANRDIGVGLDALAVGGRSHGDIDGATRCGGHGSGSGGGDVAGDHATTRAGTSEGSDVEGGLLGHATCVRRGAGAARVGLRGRCGVRGWCGGHARDARGFRDGCLGGSLRRGGFALGVGGGFPGLADGADRVADRELGASRGVDLQHRAGHRAGKLHRRFVGFDFREDVTEGDLLAFFDIPFHQGTDRHRVGQLGHIDNFSHRS